MAEVATSTTPDLLLVVIDPVARRTDSPSGSRKTCSARVRA
jgi:hypothetical protein